MKPSLLLLRHVIALSIAFGLCSVSPAATIIWNGGGSANKNWSDAGAGGNWSESTEPGASDTALFNSTAGAGAAGAGFVNNIVDASATVAGVTYAQTNTFHNTFINSGVTLTIANAVTANLLLAGTENDAGATAMLTSTISGAGGTLALNGIATSYLDVRQASGTAGTHLSTLDLSGLDTFTASIGRVLVAVQAPPVGPSIARPAGTLILAKTNVITASGAAAAILLGDGGSNGGTGIMQLGQTNAIFADTIVVSGQKSSGGLLAFNPSFVTPTAYFRGASVNRVSTITISDQSALNTATTSSSGTMDLSGGTVDAMVDTIFIGK